MHIAYVYGSEVMQVRLRVHNLEQGGKMIANDETSRIL
jgi:hypothetical protein